MRSVCPLFICLLACLSWGCVKKSSPIAEPAPVPTEVGYKHIFKLGDDGYSCFRIPAIVKTTKGTLLAFAEGRKNDCADEGNIDLVVKRSTDQGKTWGPLLVVWSDGDNTCGNPAPVVDQLTGKIHLLMTWNLGTDDIATINAGNSKDTRRAYLTSSADDGLVWSAPKEITSSVKQASWGWYATGPGHGIQLSKGTHKGRLVIPCDYIEVGSGRKGFSHVIYSDDAGATWVLGGITPAVALNPNESTVAELSDGKLMLNMRVTNNNNLRMSSISDNGGLSWSSPISAITLVDPVCQGSLVAATINSRHTLFFSNPASITRTNLTLKMSVDDGKSWSKQLNIFAGLSGYSDITILSDTQIGVLYEAGINKYWDGIAYKSINIADLK